MIDPAPDPGLPVAPRPSPWPGAAFGALWGFGLFIAALPFAGHGEPWDVLPGYYLAVLFVGGMAAPFCVRTRPTPFWLGLVVGQQAYVVFVSARGPGNLWPIGLAFAMVASLLGPVGWSAGCWLARRKRSPR